MRKVFYLIAFIAVISIVSAKASANNSNELAFLQFEPTDTPAVILLPTNTPILLPSIPININTPTPTTKLNLFNGPTLTQHKPTDDMELISPTPILSTIPTPVPTKMPLDKKAAIDLEKAKEQSLTVEDFKLISNASDLKAQLEQETNADSLDDVAEKIKNIRDTNNLANQFDAEKSKEAIEQIQYWNRYQIKDKVCAATYRMLFDNFIEKYYNLGKMYDDKADKTALAYSLYKQQYKNEIPWEVDAVFWLLREDLHDHGRDVRGALSYINSAVNDVVASSSTNYQCYAIAKLYYDNNAEYDIAGAVSVMKASLWWQNRDLNYMKEILAQFNEEDSFNEEFTNKIGCLYNFNCTKKY